MSAGYCTSFQTVYEPEIGYKKLIPAVEEGGGGEILLIVDYTGWLCAKGVYQSIGISLVEV